MTLPPLDAQGLLPTTPSACHSASSADIEHDFVVGARTHHALRRELWDAYRLWERRAQHHLGHGEVWLAGTFISGLPREPQLRIVMFPDTPSMVGNAVRRGEVGIGLLTIEDMFFMSPPPGGTVQVMRAVGGMIDSQVGSPAQKGGWEAMWSIVGDPQVMKQFSAGYVSLRI